MEDHRGKFGWVGDEPVTINDLGPLPEGFSATPPLDILTKHFTALIQARLDEFAKTRNYDSALTCASYATSMNAKFAAEGQYMVEARDATWAKGYTLIDSCAAPGVVPTWGEVEAQLPVLAWPEETGAAS